MKLKFFDFLFIVKGQVTDLTVQLLKFSDCYGGFMTHYVIKFVSDLRQVGGFLRVLRFPPPIKLTATI
jgi:hypothetical protein